MYIISLENTAKLDFGREKWIKNYSKDYSYFNLSGSTFSDSSIQVEDN